MLNLIFSVNLFNIKVLRLNTTTISQKNTIMTVIKNTLFLLLLINTFIISNAQENTMEQISQNTVVNGLVTKESTTDFETTYTKLKQIIVNNPNLKLLFELDHQKNAASVDLKLRPTRVLFFGNPKLGTPLMQNAATTGIDLPQKIIVFQDDDGKTKVSYNDPKYLKSRHNIENSDPILDKISGALDKITNGAIAK